MRAANLESSSGGWHNLRDARRDENVSTSFVICKGTRISGVVAIAARARHRHCHVVQAERHVRGEAAGYVPERAWARVHNSALACRQAVPAVVVIDGTRVSSNEQVVDELYLVRTIPQVHTHVRARRGNLRFDAEDDWRPERRVLEHAPRICARCGAAVDAHGDWLRDRVAFKVRRALGSAYDFGRRGRVEPLDVALARSHEYFERFGDPRRAIGWQQVGSIDGDERSSFQASELRPDVVECGRRRARGDCSCEYSDGETKQLRHQISSGS